MSSIVKGDEVIVISGKDKGKKSKVLAVFPKKDKALVENVNIIKKHTKANQNSQGGILEKPFPILLSKLMLLDPKTGKPTRVKIKLDKAGKRTRIAKSGAEIPVTKIRK